MQLRKCGVKKLVACFYALPAIYLKLRWVHSDLFSESLKAIAKLTFGKQVGDSLLTLLNTGENRRNGHAA